MSCWEPGTHDKDLFVDFKTDGHKYLIDWERDGEWTCNDISVTGFIKQYFPSFDADQILDAVDASRKPFWRRCKKYKGMNKKEIKALWKKNGDEARMAGTALHEAIENYYLLQLWSPSQGPTIYTPEWLQFKEYADDVKDKPFNVEWVVYSDKAHSIVGTIDMVYIKKAEGKKLTLKLVDWKRTKAIKMWAQDAGTGPCASVPNANFFHYSLQLNVYKYILENFYNGVNYEGKVYEEIDVASMYIVVFHPRLKRHAKFKCPNMQKIVREMFVERWRKLGRRRVSSVRGADGNLEDEHQPGLPTHNINCLNLTKIKLDY